MCVHVCTHARVCVHVCVCAHMCTDTYIHARIYALPTLQPWVSTWSLAPAALCPQGPPGPPKKQHPTVNEPGPVPAFSAPHISQAHVPPITGHQRWAAVHHGSRGASKRLPRALQMGLPVPAPLLHPPDISVVQKLQGIASTFIAHFEMEALSEHFSPEQWHEPSTPDPMTKIGRAHV